MTAIPEIIGGVATAAAIVGVALNNHKLRACFIVFLFSNSLCLGLHAYAGIWSLVARDAAFLLLAVHGLYKWSKPAACDCGEPAREGQA